MILDSSLQDEGMNTKSVLRAFSLPLFASLACAWCRDEHACGSVCILIGGAPIIAASKPPTDHNPVVVRDCYALVWVWHAIMFWCDAEVLHGGIEAGRSRSCPPKRQTVTQPKVHHGFLRFERLGRTLPWKRPAEPPKSSRHDSPCFLGARVLLLVSFRTWKNQKTLSTW